MFKKSFAEILKENLNEESFKPPDPINTTINTLISDSFMCDLKIYYITVEDIKNIYGSRSFYKKLFKAPVKMIFYWCEEDWQGSLFVIYSFKNKYIYIKGYFGSCEVCDNFPDTEESLEKTFNNLQITDNIDNITLSDYSHPDLLKNFDKFKNKTLKQKKRTIQQTKIEQLNRDEETTEHNHSEKTKHISWASLFK
jgi:hypothetical protein